MKKRKIIGLEMGLKAENQSKFKIQNYPQKFDPKSGAENGKNYPFLGPSSRGACFLEIEAISAFDVEGTTCNF